MLQPSSVSAQGFVSRKLTVRGALMTHHNNYEKAFTREQNRLTIMIPNNDATLRNNDDLLLRAKC